MNIDDLAVIPYRVDDPLDDNIGDYQVYIVKNESLFDAIGTVHETEDGWNSWAFLDLDNKQEFEDRQAGNLKDLLLAIAEQL